MIDAPALRARPVRVDDAGFLAALYLSTRPDLGCLPVPRSVIYGIARHQQDLQRQDYALRYPKAQDAVLEAGDAAVGRLVLQRGSGALRVVDLSIAPAARRRGHARTVLARVQAEAAAAGLAVALRVRADNPAARALYARMGFVEDAGTGAEAGPALELRWTGRAPGQNE